MQYLSTDLAIFKRLTGYPLDNEGRPVLDAAGIPNNRNVFGPPFQSRFNPLPNTTGLAAQENRWPSWGVRIPMAKSPYQIKQFLTRNDPAAVKFAGDGFQQNSYRQIPVFDENLDGRDWKNVWPCVTFRLQREQPQQQTFIYSDDFKVPVGSTVNITNKDGDIIQTGKNGLQRKQHPDSYDFYYLIRAFSKNRIELGLICDAIKYLFPMKSGIEIQLADGTSHVCDMLMEDSVTLDFGGDDLSMAFTPEEQRYYCRGFIYRIEGYFDNSVNAFGTNDLYTVNIIQDRILEIANLQNALLFTTDQNKDEYAPIED